MLSPRAALSKDKSARSLNAGLQSRHFAQIAAIITRMPDRDQREEVAEHFAAELGYTNANFDRARFLAACGMER